MNLSPSTLSFILLLFFVFVISAYVSYEHKNIAWRKLILGCSLPPLIFGLLYTLIILGTLEGMAILVFLPLLFMLAVSSLIGGLFGAGVEAFIPSADKVK